MAADWAWLQLCSRGQAAQHVSGLRLVPRKHSITISSKRHAERLHFWRMPVWSVCAFSFFLFMPIPKRWRRICGVGVYFPESNKILCLLHDSFVLIFWHWAESNLQTIPRCFSTSHILLSSDILGCTLNQLFSQTYLQICSRRLQFHTGQAQRGWTTCALLSATLEHDSIFHMQTYPRDLKAGSRVWICLSEPDKLLE